VTTEEVLSSSDDVAQHDCGTQGVQNVFVVGVQHETLGNSTLEADDGG